MPQDAFTLKYLCSELNELLVGGKINRIVIDFGKIKAPQVNVSLEDYEFENEDEIYI